MHRHHGHVHTKHAPASASSKGTLMNCACMQHSQVLVAMAHLHLLRINQEELRPALWARGLSWANMCSSSVAFRVVAYFEELGVLRIPCPR